MRVCTTYVTKKRGHEFERDQKVVHGRVWREEREGQNDVIISSKLKS